MSKKAKERWNKMYKDGIIPKGKILKLVKEYAYLSQGRKALDIACGWGKNTRYLAENGFEMDALDISSIAIEFLQNIENIDGKEVDLDGYILKENAYDLIVMSYFLGRNFFAQFHKALKPNGILIIEHFVEHSENSDEFLGARNTFSKGELLSTLDEGFTLIYSSQQKRQLYDNREMMTESIVVRKS